ncbi:MAG TPA: hypothetical protein VMN60_00550 [Longimicrobiales bacterium]|nr:hypothetical protein [Longimicrobiales bacterium]
MANTGPAAFRLTKWYLDLVTDEGAAFVGYYARLTWRGLRVRYAAALWAAPEAPTQARWSLRHGQPAQVHGNTVAWRGPARGEHGTWEILEPGYQQRLYESDHGCVDWTCITPRARVTLHTAHGCERGTGYVECLRLSILPWTLPLDTLHWGRFHAPGHTITWIEWVGPSPVRLAWHNGVLDTGATMHERTLLLPASRARLELARGRIIRDASVLSTVLEAMPMLQPLLPATLTDREQKFVGTGELLRDDGAAPIAGVALHERVTRR